MTERFEQTVYRLAPMIGVRISAKLAVLTVLAFLLMAFPATGRVLIGRGIDGVSLGDTEAGALLKAGPRQAGKAPPPMPGETAPSSEVLSNYYEGLHGFITFGRDHRVVSISTEAPHQRTASGIHTAGEDAASHGSSLRQLEKAYPNIQCHGGTAPVCVLTSHRHGRRVYTAFIFFELERGVSAIEIGYRLAVHF
jgi:hypothetical protein